jgi:hypothetical protein
LLSLVDSFSFVYFLWLLRCKKRRICLMFHFLWQQFSIIIFLEQTWRLKLCNCKWSFLEYMTWSTDYKYAFYAFLLDDVWIYKLFCFVHFSGSVHKTCSLCTRKHVSESVKILVNFRKRSTYRYQRIEMGHSYLFNTWLSVIRLPHKMFYRMWHNMPGKWWTWLVHGFVLIEDRNVTSSVAFNL